MRRLWICVAFLAIHGKLASAYDSDELNSWYYDNDYEDNLESTEYGGEKTKSSNEYKSVEDTPSNIKFKSVESDKQYDFQDYQFEDNRLEINEENAFDANDLNSEKHTENQNKIEYLSSTDIKNIGINVTVFDNDKTNASLTKNGSNVELLGTPEVGLNDNRKIFEETKAILSEKTENDFSQNGLVELSTEKTDYSKIFQETTRLLTDSYETMSEENKSDNGESQLESDEEDFEESQESTEKDSIEQAINEIKTDLKVLQEAWNKLNDSDYISESDEKDIISVKSISSSEENEDTDNIAEDENQSNEEQVGEAFLNVSQLNKETNVSHPILFLNDALPAAEIRNTNTEADKTAKLSSSLSPVIITQEIILRGKTDNIQSTNRNELTNGLEKSSTITAEEFNQTTPSIEDLSSSQVDALMKNFSSQHRITEVSLNDIRNANNVWLTIDSPVVITSPDFPRPYPPNSIIDWMISGDGIGIEMNITEFSINGFVGDYLLIKPGGVDESGSTGLIFSYSLNTERRFRFLDVDKMFVRFEARPGPQMLRGFSFSVRMVVPRPGAPIPEPERTPEKIEPSETITLNLGGVSLDEFHLIEEQFREIIAQMAATYIINNGIDPGINTTLQMTQITRRAFCFRNWPQSERCVAVSFGVPLVHDDDDEREPRLNASDLAAMWKTYSQLPPYSEKLAFLGITEFEVPNDQGILTIWLVVAAGVVISMVMLAFALWRFSCFGNYTRMPAFSDTESIKEKRNLDLYPTPHQTLPPLFTETDYKWADAKYDDTAKGEVGDYVNRSYIRNDPFDLDSDEEIVPVGTRNTSFSPRDIYSV